MDAVLPLDQMTVEEKLRAMEAIWRSLSTREEQVPVPDWHKQVLDERQRQIDAGEARFVSLEEMKERVRKRTEWPAFAEATARQEVQGGSASPENDHK